MYKNARKLILTCFSRREVLYGRVTLECAPPSRVWRVFVRLGTVERSFSYDRSHATDTETPHLQHRESQFYCSACRTRYQRMFLVAVVHIADGAQTIMLTAGSVHK